MPRIQFITSYATEVIAYVGGKEYDVDPDTASDMIGHGIAKPTDIPKKVKVKDEVVTSSPAK